jgi:opacity protein-like surface antigen
MKKRMLLGLVAAVMLGSAVHAAAPVAEDPATLAATYEKQAADFRALADKHDNMAGMHRGGAGSSKMNHEGVVHHCEQIAKDLRAAAKESDELAAKLREEAKK